VVAACAFSIGDPTKITVTGFLRDVVRVPFSWPRSGQAAPPWADFGLDPEALLRIGRWPAKFLIRTLALAIIYRYGPSWETAR
jgi:hypothetical protein